MKNKGKVLKHVLHEKEKRRRLNSEVTTKPHQEIGQGIFSVYPHAGQPTLWVHRVQVYIMRKD